MLLHRSLPNGVQPTVPVMIVRMPLRQGLHLSVGFTFFAEPTGTEGSSVNVLLILIEKR